MSGAPEGGLGLAESELSVGMPRGVRKRGTGAGPAAPPSPALPEHEPVAAVVPAEAAAAFHALLEETFEEVYSYLYRRCGGIQPIAEDLTQETYLAAIGALRTGAAEQLSAPWLMGVARHKLIDHYRRREREERRLSLIANDRSTPGQAERNGHVAGERAMQALASVPAQQRAALVLRYVDDLPVAEVAKILDRSVHATESLLARGRGTLRRRLEEDGDE